MVPDPRIRLLLSLSLLLSVLFFSIDSLASTSNTTCTTDAQCGAGKCNIDLQCECPPGYVNAPEAACVEKMQRKDHQKPFLLELFFGWIFPAGLAYELLWPLAGIRLGVEGLAGYLASGYYYETHRRVALPLPTDSIELGTSSLLPSSKCAKALKASAIAVGAIHVASWLATTIGFGELEWPDPNFKKAIHLDKGQKADLVIMGTKIAESAYVTLEHFTASSCALKEGCITGTGERRLLRFDTYIYNVGDGDFLFAFEDVVPEWSSCHKHFHAPAATSYFLKQELFNASNSTVAIRFGHKQGYCFRDTVQVSQNHSSKFDCGIPLLTRQYTQGITAGWADIYGKKLDCQWVDITDIPPGTYRLVLTVNPNALYYQDEPENNLTIVMVVIPPVNESLERTEAGVKVDSWVSKEYNQDN